MCDTEVIHFNPKDFGSDNDGSLEIHIHRKKGVSNNEKRGGLIYFHGGGAVT